MAPKSQAEDAVMAPNPEDAAMVPKSQAEDAAKAPSRSMPRQVDAIKAGLGHNRREPGAGDRKECSS